MKTIRVTKTIETVEGYEATDGTFFNSEGECKKYEETCKCVINTAFNKIARSIGNTYGVLVQGCEDEYAHIVELKTAYDVDSVNKLLCFYKSSSDNIPYSEIGKSHIIVECCGDWFDCGTPEKIKESFCKEIDMWIAPKETKEREDE